MEAEELEKEAEELPRIDLRSILRAGYIRKHTGPDAKAPSKSAEDNEWVEDVSSYFHQNRLPYRAAQWDNILESGRVSAHRYLTELLEGSFSIQRLGSSWKYTDDIVFETLSDKSVKQLNNIASEGIEELISGRSPGLHFIFAYVLKVEGGWIKVERYSSGWQATFYSDWIYYEALLQHRTYTLEAPVEKRIYSTADIYRIYKSSLDQPRRKSPGVDTALVVLMILFVWAGIQSAIDERYIVMTAAILCLVGEIVLVYLAYHRKKEITEDVSARMRVVERDISEGPDQPVRSKISFYGDEEL